MSQTRTARSGQTATLLSNTKVLVSGGFNGSPLNNAEMFDSALTSSKWSADGGLITALTVHTATLLPDGKVIGTGGYNNTFGYLSSSEVYDSGLGFLTAWQPVVTGSGFTIELGGAR